MVGRNLQPRRAIAVGELTDDHSQSAYNAAHFIGLVSKPAQALRDRAIYDFQHATAGEQFVLHQGDVRFNARRIAIHQERNGAGRGQHGDLCVAVAMLAA